MSEYSITLAPLVPWWAVAVLAIAGILLLGFALWRRARGTGWRGLAFAFVLIGLLQPRWLEEQREYHPDIAIAVVDKSLSQAIGERAEQRDDALELLRNNAARLPNLEWREISAGRSEDGQPGTRLFSEWRKAAADVPQGRRAGVFFLTDGQVHDERFASDVMGPVHVLLTGAKGERDRRLRLLQAPKYGIVGSKITLEVQVDDLGGSEDGVQEAALATVRRDGKTIDVVPVPLGIPIPVEVPLVRAGPALIDIEIGPGEHELTQENNRVVASVSGVRDRLRVLLISGKPHAGERVWRNLLKSDPAVDLVHFTILRPPEKQDATPIRELSLIAFPIRELFQEKLDDFDLIVFDRYTRRGLIPPGYLQNIAEYVRNGGALLQAVGPGYADPYLTLSETPLAAVMPARPVPQGVLEETFLPQVSDVGERHPVTKNLGGNESWGRWYRQIMTNPTRGQILMNGVGTTPLLVLERIGNRGREGRVAQFLSDHIWLWARGYEGGGPHGELLRRLAHWLMKEPELEEELLSARISGDKMVVERRTLGETAPEVRFTHPSGEAEQLTLEQVTPGVFAATLPVAGQGLYRIEDERHTVVVPVGTLDPLEFDDPRASEEILEPVTADGAGSITWIDDGVPALRKVSGDRSVSGRGWLGLRSNNAYSVTGLQQKQLVPSWLMFMLGAALLAMAWWREAR